MSKPSGLFLYAVSALAGAGASLAKNLVLDADAKGDTIDPLKVHDPSGLLEYIEAYFVADTLGAAASNAGLCTVAKGISVTDGVLTNIDVTLINASPGAGDTVSGTLYVRVNHFENLAL